ncbi:uncharacterized protein LOC128256446 [Drosophila gunungcola]|uniref:DUF4729 domain-containing protein n=1 Tax=Drosophila gunungcola TaxID=103775 RepID=A0A9P9YG21_9MUSC|nr:uncharacterized protein LOC128256446 [Drosophila gunungcola]KAI8036309.1 hypothetical protein M5D96_010902 [Drosophila gunungcola]
MDFLDPELHSIDEVYAQFEVYKKQRQEQQLELKDKLEKFNMDADLKELNSNMATLRLGMQKLEQQQQGQLRQRKLQSQTSSEAIEPAPPGETDSSVQDKDKHKIVEPEKLLIKCGVSKCLFESCQKRVDSQLLLLHYLCEHDHKDASFQRCQPLVEGERVVLSFQPQSCEFRVNQVLGLLAYGGQLEQKFLVSRRPREICSSLLAETHIPVVVLICRTATHAALKDKRPTRSVRPAGSKGNQRDQVFVIWLVTPSDRLQLNATLCLCGRDAAVRSACVVGVRQVKHSQDTSRFMAVDANYWRQTYTDVERLSNNFRDELHLEVSLTECPPGQLRRM